MRRRAWPFAVRRGPNELIARISAARHGLKAQQVPSPGQRPGYHVPTPPTPCKGKSKSQPFAHTFALTGRGVYTLIPRALPWALNWLPFQGAPFRYVSVPLTLRAK